MDTNPERVRMTAEIREQLDRMVELETELKQIRENVAEYLSWNESDAQAVRQNMALRNSETGERR